MRLETPEDVVAELCDLPCLPESIAKRLNMPSLEAHWESAAPHRFRYPVMRPPLSNELMGGLVSLQENAAGYHVEPRDDCLRGLEREVLDFTAKIHGIDPQWESWITTGGTESNLTGLSMARRFFRDQYGVETQVVSSVRSHESIFKACELLGMDHVVAAVDDACRMAIDSVIEEVTSIVSGGTAVVLVGNIGTTDCGAIDPHEIFEFLNAEHLVWVHLDACIGAFTAIFGEPEIAMASWRPSSIALDFHKYGGAPIGAGAYYGRQGCPTRSALYSGVDDRTILGSRPAYVGALTWAALAATGCSGLRTRYAIAMNTKQAFLESVPADVPLVHTVQLPIVGWRRHSDGNQPCDRYHFMPHHREADAVEAARRMCSVDPTTSGL